jgi:hypothetical protein
MTRRWSSDRLIDFQMISAKRRRGEGREQDLDT